MRAQEFVSALAGFERRGPGTDAERRAARWLAGELTVEKQGVRIEPFWCRPNWALAHAWHVALALAGSLVSVGDPAVGTALLALALASIVADDVLGASLGRRLTPERASQNVFTTPSSTTPGSQNVLTKPPSATPARSARLIITANYDAGRIGLVYRDTPRATAARLRRLIRGVTPGWLGWLAIAIVWLLAIGIVRLEDAHPPGVIGAIQFPPTVALVICLALLLETASAGYGPAGGDNATGTAVAVALARALAADPPRNLTVELLLQGAGEGQGLGMRRYLRARLRELKRSNAVVLGIAACGAGRPGWWMSDGRLVPLRYARPLRALCAQTGARPHRGRGATPALLARVGGLSAIAIGCLDARGLVPRSHQPGDTPEPVDEAALDGALELGLALVAAIDASLATAENAPTPPYTAPTPA